MATFSVGTPFGDEPLAEVDLKHAPLARVITQLRYPRLASMADDTIARTFARLVSDSYPIFEETREVNWIIGSAAPGQQEQMTRPVWRLQTAANDWSVTLGQNSLALETTEYPGRQDFCERFVSLVKIFNKCANPPRFDRLGVRYINRITDMNIISQVEPLVRPEIVGMAALRRPDGNALNHAVMEAQFDHGDTTLLVKTGFLPPEATIDLAITPVHTSSWILDIDSFVSDNLGASGAATEDQMVHLASRAYRFFRYSVSDEFLDLFQGAA